MMRLRYCSGLLTLGSVGVLGAGSVVHSESHEPSQLISESDIPRLIAQEHNQDKEFYSDLAELPSLGEDGHCHGRVGPYTCWGIFDGHSGWSTSTHVANNILDYLNAEYSKRQNQQKSSWLYAFTGSSSGNTKEEDITPEEFNTVISDAFVKLDNDILQAPLRALAKGDTKLAAAALPVAASGSCAMMAFYNPVRNLLKVALVGDSRTVLGYQTKDGIWHSKALTEDQTGGNPAEIARIRAEHPNDPAGIVRNGRVLGFQPSRSFGDATTKYTKEEVAKLQKAFWMKSASAISVTPPYLTAKPTISTVQLDPTRPSFMVMGCDGIYEWLSNEQLVGLVGQWLEKNPVIESKPYAGVVDHSTGYDSADFKRPEALGWGPLQPIVKDSNAGTHIIRNALGGAEFKKVSMLMSIPSPMSRRFRDDMTCTVVFFIPETRSKL